MQLSSAVLEMIDSPALSFRDAQKIFSVARKTGRNKNYTKEHIKDLALWMLLIQ